MSAKNKIFTIIKGMDDKLPEDHEQFQAAAVMVAPIYLRTFNLGKISKELGIARSEVCRFAFALRKNGIWKGRKIHANWDHPEQGGVDFWLCVGVAVGLFQRA